MLDALHKLGLCHGIEVFVCLSVCHTPVLCRYCIIKHFSPSVSHTIPVFRTKRHGNIPIEIPRTVASIAGVYEKIAIFDQYIALSYKRIFTGQTYTDGVQCVKRPSERAA